MIASHDSEEPANGPVRCRVSTWAWAKINLYLHVTGRRPDGYHEIDSLIAFAGMGDRIEIAPADDLELRLSGPRAAEVPGGRGNLALEAAEALSDACRPAGGIPGCCHVMPIAG